MSLGGSGKYVPSTQRGVIYFSTVPRDMRPLELRLHFNKFGEIRRMKFVPYPKKERRPGGPLLPLQFKEGWMEFINVEDAKSAAEHMNGSEVDCKRHRKCYGQLWTVKYLPEFSWDTMTEEREAKRRGRRAAEVEARKEERDTNEAYRRLVMQAAISKRQKRVKRQREEDVEEGGSDTEVTTSTDVEIKRVLKHNNNNIEDSSSSSSKKKKKGVERATKKEKDFAASRSSTSSSSEVPRRDRRRA